MTIQTVKQSVPSDMAANAWRGPAIHRQGSSDETTAVWVEASGLPHDAARIRAAIAKRARKAEAWSRSR